MKLRALWRWLGTIACLALTAIGALSLLRTDRADRMPWYFSMGGGQLKVVYQETIPCDPVPGYPELVTSGRDWMLMLVTFGVWPKYASVNGYSLTVPLYIPFLLIAVPTALSWRLARRAKRPGHCRKCGYTLTGNTSGRCSECGTEIARVKS